MNPKFEKVPLGDKKSILAFRFSSRNFEAPWHFHPQHELTLIEKSNGTKFIGDYVGPFEKGELVLLRSNLPHCWKNDSNSSDSSASIVIQWNKGIFAKVYELEGVFTMLKAASKGIIFDKKDVDIIQSEIKKTLGLEKTALYLQLQNILVKLSELPYKQLSNRSFIDDLPSEYTSRMRKIHDFIDHNYQKKIYLKDLAALVSMSEQSFSRFFSKIMGKPFFTFLNEYRIHTANKMLIDTDWSVREICFACGYESLAFFHRQFHKFNNTTPSKYRKSHRIK
ncbi:AraC family transcriptional regulator [Polaribacter reichenbachii]|uniref:AraC family transcriptional regulator n=1 Tax=Polaribacter reichenbachii TaxID=996801 RepID=A0A1B8TX00_9FLAO|nr:AraC family transcriptional regulator [Polaribacter reichenbachii]APZ48054.1 AraC family transcriptional regulator [Polaribacter reichenbachii]AUC20528.1 AraC family transcriptional regulator [Polaribacter reichenbachii]OBY63995.1 AraC family transcriptional regulator [Polaribacter reichenbachii]